uniref:SWIRM domain-containing protein n=1 Tax=Physcomitrium patens TaxID=3218 RepID=A0A7I4F3X5_PHYPA
MASEDLGPESEEGAPGDQTQKPDAELANVLVLSKSRLTNEDHHVEIDASPALYKKDMVPGFCAQNGPESTYEWSGKEDLKSKTMDNEEEHVVTPEPESVVASEKTEVGLATVVVSVSTKHIEIALQEPKCVEAAEAPDVGQVAASDTVSEITKETELPESALLHDVGQKSVRVIVQQTKTVDVEVPEKQKRKRRQKATANFELEEQEAGRRNKRPSRQHSKVSTYDESAMDKVMEEQIEGSSSRKGAKRKHNSVIRGIETEAMVAAALGFPRDSLTEEEIAANVVSVVGGKEQENYIVVRNHILAAWRENVNVWLEQETVMENIRSTHSKLVASAYKFLLFHGYINFGVAPTIKARFPAERNKAKVIIVGAGLAGLGAARHLMALGHQVIVLEGRQRPGGRVYTKRMEVDSIHAAADLGGSVVTGMHGNPLGVFARQMNWAMHKIKDLCPIYQPNGQPAVDEVDKKVEAQFNQLLDTCSKWREENESKSSYISLGNIMEFLRHNCGMGTIPAERQLFDWHFANLEYANAQLLTNLSLSDWDQDDPYEMGGDHCFLPGGNVQLIEVLCENVPILYGKTVKRIRYRDGGVKVETADETFEGEMVLCTVPLGVLKRNLISFEPPLPQYKVDAIQRLGFGLLNKVVMLFPKVFWDGHLDTFGHLEEDPHKRGEYFMFYSYAAVAGGPLLVALVAGEAAIAFESTTPVEAVTRVMTILRGIFEPKGIKVPNPVQTVCTRWGSDHLCFGSYSNVAVGASGQDYDIMAESVNHRLFFAGEATIRKYPATMHGALLSGYREAANMARAALARLEPSKPERIQSRDLHSYSTILVDLFKEPDLVFGNFSVIFNQQK